MKVKASLSEREVLEAIRAFTGDRMGPGWTGVQPVLYVDKETHEVTATCDVANYSQMIGV